MEAVKFTDAAETNVSGLAAPYGGPFGGKDLDGEYFSQSTDFALDWYDEIPLLYHHGRDPEMETTVVGRVKSRQSTDAGVWAEAQLDASNKYFEVIRKLVKAGKLFFSSGAVSHLVQTDHKSGEITRWPMVELSLTPTPSNLLATASSKAALTAATRNNLDDADFAYVDSDGKGHFPIHDAAHAKSAVSMFAQHHFPDAATRTKADRKIMAAAKKFGIDVADDSAVAQAASGKAINITDLKAVMAQLDADFDAILSRHG